MCTRCGLCSTKLLVLRDGADETTATLEDYKLSPELVHQLARPRHRKALELLHNNSVYTTKDWAQRADSKLHDDCGAVLGSVLDELAGIKPRVDNEPPCTSFSAWRNRSHLLTALLHVLLSV